MANPFHGWSCQVQGNKLNNRSYIVYGASPRFIIWESFLLKIPNYHWESRVDNLVFRQGKQLGGPSVLDHNSHNYLSVVNLAKISGVYQGAKSDHAGVDEAMVLQSG